MNRENECSPAFREVQQFRQIWIWAIVIAIAGLMWYAFVIQVLFRRPFGDNPMPDILMIVFWLLFGLGLPALFFFGKLITEVRSDGIYIRFFPFHLSFQKIAFKDLKRYKTRTYRPLLEYGGWGIRYGFAGKAYNVSGNRGVQLEFLNGKRLLIGSQRAEEFLQAIEMAYGKQQDTKTS
jgi:hypothetical protein